MSNLPEERQLVCEIEGGSTKSLIQILQRVRRMFDVNALPEEINRVLNGDPKLKILVEDNPGLRLPGAFSEFEIAIRAIVGQQISVKGATTVMGTITELYGKKNKHGIFFPEAKRLSRLDPESLPMPRKRAQAIKDFSQQINSGAVRFDTPDDDEFYDLLVAIAGIGPWTAQYIALRARGNPDSFLVSDLVIKKVADAFFDIQSEKALSTRSEQWQPWRGYAGMHLWRHSAKLGA